MASVILAGTGAIHFFVVLAHQGLPPFRVSPNPVFEGIPNGLLFLCGQGGFFGVQHPALLAVCVLHSVINANIPEIQRIFQDAVSVGAVCAIGGKGRNVVVGYLCFAGDLPLGGVSGIVHINGAAQIPGRVKGFIHELTDIFLVNPGSTQANFDLRCLQVLGLGSFQGFHIDGKSRIAFRCPLCGSELLTDIAGQIFVCGLPAGKRVTAIGWVFENNAGQFCRNFLGGFTGQLGHILHIHPGLFRNGNGKGFAGGVYRGHSLVGLDGTFGKHIRLALQLPVLVQYLQRTQEIVRRIVRKGQPVPSVIDKPVFGGKRIIEPVQFPLLFPNSGVRRILVHLKVNELMHTVAESNHSLDAGLGGGVQVRFYHAAVFPEVHLAIHHSIRVVFHVGVCRDGGVEFFALAQLRQLSFLIGAANILRSVVELIGQLQPLNRCNREVLPAILGAFGDLSA
ncbi:Uncharacterised protein [Enterocloster clostridioformis]|uniref:Uncharacterized protein n=1 Tax=Enterocloster clostridioformis TaxID=1531 RepID=A0A174RL55_9FIRM|nr:Uncharacterised protein [Enterocloster clostridioformis]